MSRDDLARLHPRIRDHLRHRLTDQPGFQFLPDTRLRQWLSENANGWRVLTPAYTGSLGVAAGAWRNEGRTDRPGRIILNSPVDRGSHNLPEENLEIIQGISFESRTLTAPEPAFDCVILDPPFFSTTDAGKVDLQNEMTRLINKVRPLTAHDGW